MCVDGIFRHSELQRQGREKGQSRADTSREVRRCGKNPRIHRTRARNVSDATASSTARSKIGRARAHSSMSMD